MAAQRAAPEVAWVGDGADTHEAARAPGPVARTLTAAGGACASVSSWGRHWFVSACIGVTAILVAWVFLPLDLTDDGRVEPLLFGLAFHAPYAGVAAALGWSMLAMVLPLPSPWKVCASLVGAAVVDGVLVVLALTFVEREADGTAGVRLQTLLPASVLCAAVPFLIYLTLWVRSVNRGNTVAVIPIHTSADGEVLEWESKSVAPLKAAPRGATAGAGAGPVRVGALASSDSSDDVHDGRGGRGGGASGGEAFARDGDTQGSVQGSANGGQLLDTAADVAEQPWLRRQRLSDYASHVDGEAPGAVLVYPRGGTPALHETSVVNSPLAVFARLLLAYIVLFAAYYYCQVFTALFLRGRDSLSSTARVIWVYVFRLSLFVLRSAMSAATDPDAMRSAWEPCPDDVRHAFVFGLEAMGMLFARNLFLQLTSISAAVSLMALHLVQQVLLGPARTTRVFWTMQRRAVSCVRRARGKPVLNYAALDAALRAQGRDPFLEDTTEMLIGNVYTKVAEAVSIVAWFAAFTLHRFGPNASLYPFQPDDTEGAEEYTTVVIVFALFVAFEAVAVLLTTLRARAVSKLMWRRVLEAVVKSPARTKVALLVIGMHVAQDVAVAVLKQSAL